MKNKNIVLDIAKRQWVFFYHDDNIYVTSNSETFTIFEDCKEDYCVICDDEGRIHLICQDNNGNIFYLLKGTRWEQRCILESKSKNASLKNFKLVNQKGWINAFYIIPQKKNEVLVHQVINMDASMPKVIDYVSSHDICAVKHGENIRVIYQNHDGALGYSEFNWQEKVWGEYRLLYQGERKLENICCLSENDALRTVLLEESGGKYQLIYVVEKNDGIESKKLFGNCFADSDPAIFKIGNRVYITFSLGIRALCCHSDNEMSFSSPSYMYPTFYKTQERVNFSSVIPIESVDIYGNYFYAIENDEHICELGLISPYLKRLKCEEKSEKKEDILEFAGIKEEEPAPWEIEIGKLKAQISLMQNEIKELTKEKVVESPKQDEAPKEETTNSEE